MRGEELSIARVAMRSRETDHESFTMTTTAKTNDSSDSMMDQVRAERRLIRAVRFGDVDAIPDLVKAADATGDVDIKSNALFELSGDNNTEDPVDEATRVRCARALLEGGADPNFVSGRMAVAALLKNRNLDAILAVFDEFGLKQEMKQQTGFEATRPDV